MAVRHPGQAFLDYCGLLPSLLLKVIVTPALIAGATLVARRWGHAMSGWLVGLPLTSGPVVFFLALDQGTRFAADAALGVILGVTSQAVFALAYVRAGARTGWPARLLAGTVAFASATVIFRTAHLLLPLESILVSLSLVAAIFMMPQVEASESRLAPTPPGDLPLRIVVATALVVGLTAIAPVLGAYLSGLVLPFPLYAAILAVFAHRLGGAAAAAAVWRGLLFGLFSFVAFFTAIAGWLPSLGILLGFVLALTVASLTQGASLLLLRTARLGN